MTKVCLELHDYDEGGFATFNITRYCLVEALKVTV